MSFGDKFTGEVEEDSNVLPPDEIMVLAIFYHSRTSTLGIMTCTGCTEILLEQGMLEIVGKRQIPGPGIPEKCMAVTVTLSPGFSLKDCQAAIAARHKGPPWPQT